MLIDYEYQGTVYSPVRLPFTVTNRMERIIQLECEGQKQGEILYLKIHTHFLLEDLDTLEHFYILKSSSNYKLVTDRTLTAEDLYLMAQHAMVALRLHFNRQITKEQADIWDVPIFPIEYMRDELEKVAMDFSKAGN